MLLYIKMFQDKAIVDTYSTSTLQWSYLY